MPMNNPVAQVYKRSFSKQDWHSDDFGLRSPVMQKTFVEGMCCLFFRARDPM